jgi:Na+/H+ antiporter NhaD/arsenite permease-like protein
MLKFAKYGLLIGGIVIGIIHLKLVGRALFVLRGDEPLSLRIFLVTGPLSTLPAAITAFFKPGIGSAWLICGSILSFVAASVADDGGVDLFSEIFMPDTLPMLVLGVIAFLLYKFPGKEQGTHR